ncbi:MAG: DMT family transporter [Thermocladium sp.]
MVVNVLPAFAAAVIWAYASVSYREFVLRLGVLRLNALRMTYSAIALLVPTIILGINMGAIYGVLSGVLSLAIGDSLYLRSIRASGVSVAVPASYSYIIMEQFMAIALGEPLKLSYLAAAGLMILGIYLLTRGGGSGNALGIAYALAAAAAWTLGYAAIRVAGVSGLGPIPIAFTRVASALPLLVVASHIDIGDAVKTTWRTVLPIVSALDLGLGSALFAYSTIQAGLAPTVIAMGTVPLLSQLISRMLGREKPRNREYASAAVMLTAIAVSFM